MNFSCIECGYTVRNIPEKFSGKRVKCHKCHTVQQIPADYPVDGPSTPKKRLPKTVKILSIGASIVLIGVIANLLFRYGGGVLEKSGPLRLIVDVVLPVFGIMLAGYLSGLFGLLGDSATEALNRYVFYIALPALFVGSLSRIPLGEIVILPFLAAFGGGTAATFLVTLALGRLIFKDRFGINSLRATSAVFANTGYMGIPLFMLLFGEAQLLPAVVSAVFVGVPVVGMATVLLELDQGMNGKDGHLILNVFAGVLKSPILISAGAGMALSGFGLELPTAAATFCKTLGASAAPCALFAIGLFMAGKPISKGVFEVSWVTGMKLVIQPLITAGLAFKVLALDPNSASAAVILSALPVGSLLFVLAQQYRIYVHRATSVILVSTVMSLATLSVLFVLLDIG